MFFLRPKHLHDVLYLCNGSGTNRASALCRLISQEGEVGRVSPINSCCSRDCFMKRAMNGDEIIEHFMSKTICRCS